MLIMIAIWLDPGLLTGVCAVDSETGELLYLDEHDLLHTGRLLDPECVLNPILNRYWDELDGFDSFGITVAVGWETYTILKGAQSQAPWSLEAIGVAKYLCAQYGFEVLKPAAPLERKVCTLKMLKDIGWYPKVKGKKDAFSAAQHTVAWWLRTDTLPEQYREAIYGPLR